MRLLAILLLLTTVAAHADKKPKPPPPGEINVDAAADSSSRSHSRSDSAAAAAAITKVRTSADAHGGDGGDSDANADANAEGGDANATANAGDASVGDISIDASTRQRGTVTIKNTPTAIAPDVFPTISCFKPQINGALSLPGFGLSGGKGKIDEGCVKREFIRMAYQMGLLDRATYMWCQQPEVYEDFPGGTAEDCLLFEVTEEEDEPTLGLGKPETEYFTVAEVDEAQFDELEETVELQSDKLSQQSNLIQELLRRLEQAEREERARKERDAEQQQLINDYVDKYEVKEK